MTTYSEDFKAERSDRERAQATIQQQKDEMAGIKQMVVVMVSFSCYVDKLLHDGKMMIYPTLKTLEA